MKQVEILILDNDTGEITTRYRETMSLAPAAFPERRFEDFARAFVRILRDTHKYPHPCIQITAQEYHKPLELDCPF